LLPKENPSRFAFGWTGTGLAGLVPGSCVGIELVVTGGLYAPPEGSPMTVVFGNFGRPKTGEWKSKASVRSPQTLRRQALMFGQVAGVPSAAVHFSTSWITEVWSATSEVTHPPRVHGEIRISGTRKPRPTGTGCVRPALASAPVGSKKNSSFVPVGGTGGGTWSNCPSFSS
jgi:hypothetical protein